MPLGECVCVYGCACICVYLPKSIDFLSAPFAAVRFCRLQFLLPLLFVVTAAAAAVVGHIQPDTFLCVLSLQDMAQ